MTKQKKWMIAAGAAALVMILGFLTLRFAGELLAPFLTPAGAPADSQAQSAEPAGAASIAALPDDTSGLIIQHGPFVVAGNSYVVRVQRDTGSAKPREAARRVQIFDSTGRVVYDENLFLRGDSTSSESWLEFYPVVLQDTAGRPRGFNFGYGFFPSAPSSGLVFNIVAPRGDSLVVLTQTVIGYYGQEGRLPSGGAPKSSRLLPGNQMTIESLRGWFTATIPLKIDFDCVPRSGNCVRIDVRDSIAGLARFPVQASVREKVDTAVVVEVFSAPHAAAGEKITVPAGQQVDILGGAGRVFFERTPSLYLSADDEWLEIRVNGRRGWITGAEAFEAIGLRQVG